MNSIDLHLTNLQPGTNFVCVGIPLPKGAVTDCDSLAIVENHDVTNSASLHSSITPTARWPDGSVKWCLTKIATLGNKTPELKLTLSSTNASAHTALVKVTEKNDSVEVKSGAATFLFNRLSVFPSVEYAGDTLWQARTCHPQLTLEDGNLCELKIANIAVQESGDLSCKIQVNGTYQINEKQTLNARFNFEVLPDAQLSLVCGLHNPHRAIHPGGIWDLGDPGSILFRDFSFLIEQPERATSVHLLAEPDSDWINATQPTVLFQASSGGKHWDNAVHVNAKGEVRNRFCGYQITADNQNICSGKRSSPTLSIESPAGTCTVIPQNFWQNFPKSLDINTAEVAVRLFPFHHGDVYELQGGERKRHQVSFKFSPSLDQAKSTDNLANPCAKVAATAYKEAGVFQYFDDQHRCKKYDRLLQPSKDNNTGFYAKRENLDEYSWRNFGDIYADHEAANHTEDRPYVSHYNNQYDPVYGFIRQYTLTGDHYWQPLFTDLANHIMDIDIYHTEEDRVEYNNGMFWHTDHYLEAHTATHRTYSATQIDKEGKPQNGGGPSSGHSYSTGLVYYYFMTGDESAKQTVIDLGNWIVNYQEGSGTLLETTRKTLQEDTANFIKTCKGAKIFKYCYPMDRETGNYIRTLMDCYDLTADNIYLHKVENIIRKTAGPSDDIGARGFDNIENTWYYVVFLQELVRYLDLKRSIDQRDKNFYHARAILLHYARWMADNEKPYIHNAEQLEFPNATWIAQEPRKVSIFYAAYKYALTNRAKFLERARYFRDHLSEELSNCDTLHYSRIQILLLQNHGAAAFIDMDSLPYPGLREVDVSEQEDCFHTPKSHLRHITGSWVSCLTKFRLSKELRWIRSRAG